MLKRLLMGALSVILFSLPWLGSTSLTLFVAFVPLLWIQRDLYGKTGKRGRPLRFWPYAVLVFTVWWFCTVWWVGYAAVIGVFAATLSGTVLMTAAFLIYHAVWRRAPRALAYTVLVTAWLGYEFIFMYNDQISFPWLVLGNAFAMDTKLVQWYEYTGVLGGSLWVLVVNLLIFEAWGGRRAWKSWFLPAVCFVVPVIVSLVIYYTYREPQQGTIRVTLVQPNLDPYGEKFFMPQRQQNELLLELMKQSPADVDLIVAPETAIDEYFWESDLPGVPSVLQFKKFIREERPGAMLIIGSNTYLPYASEQAASFSARCNDQGQWYDVYNSTLFIDSTEEVRLHHKAKLVIGVEMIPFYRVLKKFKFLVVDLGGITGQLGMDSVRKVYSTVSRGIPVGGAICYEAVYGEYFAEFARNGAQVLGVISNDGWWDDTPGHRYLFAYSQLRAIETRRSIARSANTGKSGFIDQRGDAGETLGWDERGTLTATLSLNDRITFYTRYGDMIGRLSCYILLLSLLYFMAYRIRRRSRLVE